MDFLRRENKYDWLNNSFLDQFIIKLQIWHQKWPLIFQNSIKLDMRYPLLMNSIGQIMVI
jgi:hypothetical protein